MKITFEDCLRNKKLFPFHPAKHLVDLEIEDAQADLESAQQELSKPDFKWATIKGYYSMYHAARGLLYSRGYREKSHICLYLALKKLFVEERTIDPKSVEDLYNSMTLREDADYHHKFSHEGAQAVIEGAKRFLEMAKKVLKPAGNAWAALVHESHQYASKGQYQKSIELAQKALELNPRASEAWQLIGAAYKFLGDEMQETGKREQAAEFHKKAAEAWNKAKQINPKIKIPGASRMMILLSASEAQSQNSTLKNTQKA